MHNIRLAAALRHKAAEVRNLNLQTTAKEDQTLRDAADLLRVLAKVVEGNTLAKAFGAPGDWGYQTEIGAALAAAVTPNPSLAPNQTLRGEAK